MKTLLVIILCLLSTAVFAQRQLQPIREKAPKLIVPNDQFDSPDHYPGDNLPGTELPAMLFPDEKPSMAKLPPWRYSTDKTIDTNDFNMILHVDSSHGSRIEVLFPKRDVTPLLDRHSIPVKSPVENNPQKK